MNDKLETLEYIAGQLVELEKMARAAGNAELAYLIEMASMAAREVVIKPKVRRR